MDRSSIRLMEDIVLEAREEKKSNLSKSRLHLKEKPKSKDTCCLKAQTLNLSKDSENQLLHKLNDVRGTALKLADQCEYKKNSNLGKQYWVERCQLIVKTEADPSFTKTSEVKEDSSICNDKNSQNKTETLKQNMEIKAMHSRIQTNFEYLEIDIERCPLRLQYRKLKIIETINENQVTILFGAIGCGKTTQVPQYILDEWLKSESEESNEKFGIIVTQPRQMSAIGVAKRVAAERHESVGNIVGYKVGLRSALSSHTRLTFCTEQILLERLSSDSQLDSVTHVIVDQVHERSAECDFLLMSLKKLIGLRKDLKVILMGSSPNVDVFSDYFGKATVYDVYPDGYYFFNKTEMFLEDIMDRMHYSIDEGSEYVRKDRGDWNQINEDISNADDLKKIKPARVKDTIPDEELTLPQVMGRYSKYSQITRRNIYVMDHDKINYDLIEKTLEWYIDYKSYDNPTCGALLIFLPGIEEIATMKNILEKNEKLADPKKFVIIPLHPDLTPEEQSLIFQKRKAKVLRIFLTTDIAESSVCIDDMYMKIIDAGRIKVRRFNINLHRDSFDTCWISKDNFNRRMARASHTYANYYIHLYSSFRFNHQLADKPPSEICRIALEPLLLRLKILQKNKYLDFYQALGNMLEPPPVDNINAAIKRLQYVGALDPGSMLTPLGYHLASLPVDVRIGKLILFGAIFRCVDSALTIAACLLHESPFVDYAHNKQEIKAKKREYATENSDQLTSLKIYKKWQEIAARDYDAGKIFANENFLSLDTLKVLADTKHYLLELLNHIGFVSVNAKTHSTVEDLTLVSTGQELNVNNENYKLLQGLICASLYPCLATLIQPESSATVSELSNSEEFKYLTKENEAVHVHPSSVNFNTEHNRPSQFLVYRQRIKKSKIFIRDVSEAPMLPIVLFCGYGIDIEVNDDGCTLSLGDGLISFSVGSLKVAQLLQHARMELAKLLEQKVRDPQLDLVNHPTWGKVVNAIVSIVTNG
ncbi:putative ATP-dependent RNA helicase DHX57 isoform X1 [Nasonia vitripennis]|uniref:Helicase ATP-binding domain-containing protein n=1 Tax=Nasonia vitripennis TaxID=7425 RepID=A0A7M7G6X4_NASVI|nr:putative ATP-dependent RNA helicase DHX57 isoform X1 [Nasonia vitripennis]